MKELKPCPFGCPYEVYVEPHEEGYHTFYHVRCYVCDATGPDELTEAEAIAAWNKRS